jgi:hypothetical protein
LRVEIDVYILAAMKSEWKYRAAGFRDEIPDSGEVILLSPEDQRRVVEAILNPPEPAEALIRAWHLHSAMGIREQIDGNQYSCPA